MVELVKILDGADLFLSASESAQAEDLAKVFLDSYAWLSDWSLEKGRLLFHKVMKHHTFQHLIWNAKFLNPKHHWNFKGEDYVGRISTLAHSVSSEAFAKSMHQAPSLAKGVACMHAFSGAALPKP